MYAERVGDAPGESRYARQDRRMDGWTDTRPIIYRFPLCGQRKKSSRVLVCHYCYRSSAIKHITATVKSRLTH